VKPAPRRSPGPPELSAAAEAFRAELAAVRKSSANDFGAWRRSRRWRQLLFLAATVGSFVPGAVTFLMDAPLPLSIALEVAAMVGNVWIRRERARRRQEILAWDPSVDAS
jgi:hypothetical protein